MSSYIGADRSLRTDVRNPLLRLASAQKIASLPPETREALREILGEIASDSRAKAEQCWKRHKAPMAAYWKAVSVYAGHARKLTRAAQQEKCKCGCNYPDHWKGTRV